jgi:hypothetical protein
LDITDLQIGDEINFPGFSWLAKKSTQIRTKAIIANSNRQFIFVRDHIRNLQQLPHQMVG